MKGKVVFSIMRILLGIVFLSFGIGKFQNDIWAQTIKTMDLFLKLPWDVNLSVLLIGVSEVVAGSALIIGIFTRFFSAIAALELLGILILLKFAEVRDIGLLGAALYMAVVNDDSFGIHRLFQKKEV